MNVVEIRSCCVFSHIKTIDYKSTVDIHKMRELLRFSSWVVSESQRDTPKQW